MPKTIKRKVRRRRPQVESYRCGNGVLAPIWGEELRTLYHFMPVGMRSPVQTRSVEDEVFLRTFKIRQDL